VPIRKHKEEIAVKPCEFPNAEQKSRPTVLLTAMTLLEADRK
jgi:hypothetical protein